MDYFMSCNSLIWTRKLLIPNCWKWCVIIQSVCHIQGIILCIIQGTKFNLYIKIISMIFIHSNCDCLIFSCKIDWKKGKNITQKQVKKKQKHKGKSWYCFTEMMKWCHHELDDRKNVKAFWDHSVRTQTFPKN